LIIANWGEARYTGHPEDAFIGARYNGEKPVDADIAITDSSR
jgi:hypothetical protein